MTGVAFGLRGLWFFRRSYFGVLAGSAVADRVRAAWVDRQARKGSGPSDHAPVMVDLDEAPDGDIGPMVPPPSARKK